MEGAGGGYYRIHFAHTPVSRKLCDGTEETSKCKDDNCGQYDLYNLENNSSNLNLVFPAYIGKSFEPGTKIQYSQYEK